MTANSQLLTTTPKTKQNKKILSRLEQEQNHRNGDYVEDYQWGSEMGREGGKVQRIRSINDRWKIDRGRVRIV